jgi:hypothetical protein
MGGWLQEKSQSSLHTHPHSQGHHILRVIVTRYLCQHRVEFEEYTDREQF